MIFHYIILCSHQFNAFFYHIIHYNHQFNVLFCKILINCTQVSNHLHFMDPITFKSGEIEPGYYWHNEFGSFMNTKNLAEFIIMDVEPDYSKNFKNYVYGEVTACRPDEMGDDNAIRYGITHMGNVLKAGDKVLAYDLTTTNHNDFYWEQLRFNTKARVPTVSFSF